MRIPRSLPAIVLVLTALTACGPSQKTFEESDPAGFHACQAFARSEGAGGSYYHNAIDLAAEEGSHSGNKKIRDLVDAKRAGAPVIHDLSDFRRACKRAGFNF